METTTHPSDRVAEAVREELARKRLSRQWLADRARISLSTLEKALAGRRPFTLATIVRLEDALGIALRAPHSAPAGTSPANGFAPESMGAYARPAVSWLEGDYLTLRPSFSDSSALFAYITSIGWDESRGHLIFSETARLDRQFEQQGFVCFPHLSGHIYLVTNTLGQYRMAMLNRPSGGGALYGILSTLIAGEGAQLIPSASPIALLPTGLRSDPALGLVREGEECFDEYRGHIARIAQSGFARFPGAC